MAEIHRIEEPHILGRDAINVRPNIRPWILQIMRLLSLSVLLVSAANAQGWMMADVFPLQIGKSWHYDVRRELNNLYDDTSRVDSGTVIVTLRESTPAESTVTWRIEERRDLHGVRRVQSIHEGTRDTGTYTFTLTEQLKGYHKIYLNPPSRRPTFGWLFHDDFDPDSTHVFRFQWVRSDSMYDLGYQDYIDDWGRHTHHQIFKMGIGEVFDSAYGTGEWIGFTYVSRLIDPTVLGVTPPIVEQVQPSSAVLYQNYPNPFNPTTTIWYQLTNESSVRITVFNCLGQQVRTLLNTVQSAGDKLITFDAADLPSGVYFYRIETVSASNPSTQFRQTRKMILIR